MGKEGLFCLELIPGSVDSFPHFIFFHLLFLETLGRLASFSLRVLGRRSKRGFVSTLYSSLDEVSSTSSFSNTNYVLTQMPCF